MSEGLYVPEKSAVRAVWAKPDRMLLVFAGASAEFALNKDVDWLYYTGKLPKDPLARLFSTITYAKKILFATEKDAQKAIETVNQIHGSVEQSRGANISEDAYRDVLYLLIYYTTKAYEISHGSIRQNEQEEIFETFKKLGQDMGIKSIPDTLIAWQIDRDIHLDRNLENTELSKDLFCQYKKHLGAARYWILIEGQKQLLPKKVCGLLGHKKPSKLKTIFKLYAGLKDLSISRVIPYILLPVKHYRDIVNLKLS